MAATKPVLAWIEGTEARPGLAGLWAFLDRYLKDLAGDDFDVVFAAFPRPAGGVRQAAPRLMSEALGLTAAVESVAAGADLVIFNDWAMPVHAARSYLDVPVTGVNEASAILGINSSTLYRKIQRYGLEPKMAYVGGAEDEE